jgi:hypothetical protein
MSSRASCVLVGCHGGNGGGSGDGRCGRRTRNPAIFKKICQNTNKYKIGAL